jgi:ATP-dependent DNA ligase
VREYFLLCGCVGTDLDPASKDSPTEQGENREFTNGKPLCQSANRSRIYDGRRGPVGKPRPVTPRLPDFVEPMKAKLVGFMPPGGSWIYEIKFDGYRALVLRGGSETRIFSGNQKDLGGKFPEVKDSIAALDLQDAVIDGEIVALDEKNRSPFQLLQGFDKGQERPPIVFYAFDLLQLNGKELRLLPIEERKAKLEELLKKPPGCSQIFGLLYERYSRASGPGSDARIGRFDWQTRRFSV